MAKLENRFIRIEDWKGNRYFPMSNLEASTAGFFSGSASTEEGSDPYTQGTYEQDLAANNGRSIKLASSAERKVLFRGTFVNLPFGKITIGSRLKINAIPSNPDLSVVTLKCSFRDLRESIPTDYVIDTFNIAASNFINPREYVTVPHSFGYEVPQEIESIITSKNCSLVVELSVPEDIGYTIWFDQLYVAPVIGEESKLNISVENRTIMISK